MRSVEITDEYVIQEFTSWMEGPKESFPLDSGFSPETMAAMEYYINNRTDESKEAVEREFARQMAGEHFQDSELTEEDVS